MATLHSKAESAPPAGGYLDAAQDFYDTLARAPELGASPTVLYVGVGGGLEALQFAYFSRRPGAVIAVEPVESMRAAATANLAQAAAMNDWFKPEFVHVLAGDAFTQPAPDACRDFVAQNCLFNIFEQQDLRETARAYCAMADAS